MNLTKGQEAHLDKLKAQFCEALNAATGANTFLILATKADSDRHTCFMEGKTSSLLVLILEAIYHTTEHNPAALAYLVKEIVEHGEGLLQQEEKVLN